MKTEKWNGHDIRSINIDDEQVTRAIHSLQKDGVTTSKVIDSLGRTQDVNIIIKE